MKNKGLLIGGIVVVVLILVVIGIRSMSSPGDDILIQQESSIVIEAADACLRGNQVACEYHASVLHRENLEEALILATEDEQVKKDRYLQSVNPPTPVIEATEELP